MLVAACLSAALLQSTSVESTVRADGTEVRVEYETAQGADGSRVRSGSYRVVAADGELLVRGQYEDGERQGRWLFRHPTGETLAAGGYKAGRRVGKWRSGWPDGSVRSQGRFRAGVLEGTLNCKGPGGGLDERMSGAVEFVEGTFGDAGAGHYSGWLLDGTQHGVWTAHWRDGTVFYRGAFVRGEPVGAHRFTLCDGSEDELLIAPSHEGEWTPCPLMSEPTDLGEVSDRGAIVARPESEALESIASWAAARSADESARMEEAAQAVLAGAPASFHEPETLRAAVRWAFGELGEKDTGADVRERAVGILRAVTGDARLGWAKPSSEDFVRSNARALLRAHAIVAPWSTDEPFWTVDAALVSAPELLARPRALVESTAADAGRVEYEVRPPFALWHRDVVDAALPGRAVDGAFVSAHASALDWLARKQEPDGGWPWIQGGEALAKWPLPHRPGVSALALAALVHGGSTISRGPHAGAVARATRYLLRMQRAQRGRFHEDFHVAEWLYGQSVAVWGLAELYRREPSPALGRAVREGADVILRAKNAYGGWQYALPPTGQQDTSATTWAVRALLAARSAGVTAGPGAAVDARTLVDRLTDVGTGRVGYVTEGTLSARVPGVNEHFPRENTEALTACGLLIRTWAEGGLPKGGLTEFQLRLLNGTLPRWSEDGLAVDFYYWFAGTLVARTVAAEEAHPFPQKWTRALMDTLVPTQRIDGEALGSWDPIGAWCFAGGRTYSTAMGALAIGALWAD